MAFMDGEYMYILLLVFVYNNLLFPSRYDSTRNELISDEIGVAYSIQNGIPNLIPHDGRLIKKNGTTSTTNVPNQDS